MSWNFRVAKQGQVFRIIEVHYDSDGNMTGWGDTYDSLLIWDDYDDLEGTVDKLQHAFEKPLLEIGADNKLREVAAA